MNSEERKTVAIESNAKTNHRNMLIALGTLILAIIAFMFGSSTNGEKNSSIQDYEGDDINVTGGTVNIYQPSDDEIVNIQSSEIINELENLKEQIRIIQNKFEKGGSVYMQYEGIIRYLGNNQTSASNKVLLKRIKNAKIQLQKVK